ncbi:MAG: flagellar motor switch protein FliM [Verrucomicrobiota bacterium]|nr:flagellar motor switch protein FliM [Verrucomicrobiota bacterium]MCC6822539.1 flagellar motor switch protein FliM [Limisphaerales bacterium]
MDPTETSFLARDAVPAAPDLAAEDAAAAAKLESLGSPGAASRDTLATALQFSGEPPSAKPQPYAFAQHSLLSAHELRKLRSDHEEFLASLAARLSIYFRTEFDLTLGSLQTATYRQLVSSLAQPTHVTLFQIEPLRGISLLEISPAFGLVMTDRLMGGSGEATPPARALSEIEVVLLDSVAQFITAAWCGQWRHRPELKPALLGHESDPRYLQTARPDSPFLVATLNTRLGKINGQLQLAVPFATLEPLLEHLRAELAPAAETAPPAVAPKVGPWPATLHDMPLALAAQLPGPQLLARALTDLRIGQVLDLPADAVQQVQLRLGGLTRFTGRLGTRDNYWAVEVTDVSNTA